MDLVKEPRQFQMNTKRSRGVDRGHGKPGTFIDEFRVRVSETDPGGLATPRAISDYLQEVATEHSLILGNSIDVLFKKGMTWVVSRICFRMDSLPAWRDTLQVETWPVAVQLEGANDRNGQFMLRDFVFTGEDGQRLGAGTSSWSVIDLEARRPIRIPDWIRVNAKREDRAIQFGFPSLPEPTGQLGTKNFNVRLGDLDVNKHVNYLNYISWALESMPLDSLATRRLKELDVSFRAEGLYGDTIRSSTALDLTCSTLDGDCSGADDDLTYNHTIVRVGDGRELARLRTVWQL